MPGVAKKVQTLTGGPGFEPGDSRNL